MNSVDGNIYNTAKENNEREEYDARDDPTWSFPRPTSPVVSHTDVIHHHHL
jgi:hypothetical protein